MLAVCLPRGGETKINGKRITPFSLFASGALFCWNSVPKPRMETAQLFRESNRHYDEPRSILFIFHTYDDISKERTLFGIEKPAVGSQVVCGIAKAKPF